MLVFKIYQNGTSFRVGSEGRQVEAVADVVHSYIIEIIINNTEDKTVKNKNVASNGTANTCTFNLEFLILQSYV